MTCFFADVRQPRLFHYHVVKDATCSHSAINVFRLVLKKGGRQYSKSLLQDAEDTLDVLPRAFAELAPSFHGVVFGMLVATYCCQPLMLTPVT